MVVRYRQVLEVLDRREQNRLPGLWHHPTQVEGWPMRFLPIGPGGYSENLSGTRAITPTGPPSLKEGKEEGQEEETQAALLGSKGTVLPCWWVS